MSIKDLVPKLNKDRGGPPAKPGPNDLFRDLQRQMNDLFDGFFSGFNESSEGRFPSLWNHGLDWPSAAFNPRVDVKETAKQVRVTAELPGVDEDDFHIELDESVLTIRGEKRQENKTGDEHWTCSELSYGSFQRSVALPARVDASSAKAKFKKGVVTITLPKLPEEQRARKRIAIEAA